MAASTRMVATNPQATINHFRSVITGPSSRTSGHVFHPTHSTGAKGTKTKEELEKMESGGAVPHADVHQVISVASKVNEGVIVTSCNTRCEVSATGHIVPHGKPNPTDVKTAYIHFHPYGEIVSGKPGKYLLVPTMRPANAVNNDFECPVTGSTVRVLCANKSLSTIEVKDVNLDDPGSVSATDILWLLGSVSGIFRRLYVMPDDVRKLYMAADAAGNMFLTEDVPNQPIKGQENPQTYLHFYWNYQVVEKN